MTVVEASPGRHGPAGGGTQFQHANVFSSHEGELDLGQQEESVSCAGTSTSQGFPGRMLFATDELGRVSRQTGYATE